ncbi:MAG: cytochrome c [Nitrospiraceae bacterium]|nr:cytochrome c [Nitrospiraceae bacterium]
MRAKLIVMQAAAFDNWYEARVVTPSSPSAAGLALLQSKGCLLCHTTTGKPLVGPSYKGIYGTKVTVMVKGHEEVKTVDEKYLKFMITHPKVWVVKGYPPIMPKTPLTDKEVDEIIAYIKTLK